MVCVYLDDILVSGKTQQDHLANLHEVLTRLESAGLHLKRGKCSFCQLKVTYLGQIICANGLKSSPNKVRAVSDLPSPSKVTELKTFLGLVNYYAKFLPDLATTLAPLYKLLKNLGNGPQSKRPLSRMLRNRCCLPRFWLILMIASQLLWHMMLLLLELEPFCHRFKQMDQNTLWHMPLAH